MDKRRTTIILDKDLVAEAEQVLETKNTTDTVHEALREAIHRVKLRKISLRDMPVPTPEELKEMRKPRSFD